MNRVLRDVVESDIDAFYEHQREPEATEMAVSPARDRDAFDAQWRRLLHQEDDRSRRAGRRKRRLLGAGRAAPDRLLGRQGVLGHGLATRALAEFVEDLPRPLHAWVVGSNVGLIRLLEKCGFVAVGLHTEHNENVGRDVEEVLYELASRSSRYKCMPRRGYGERGSNTTTAVSRGRRAA